MLFYVKTKEAVQPDQKYEMNWNSIFVTAQDLNLDFAEI